MLIRVYNLHVSLLLWGVGVAAAGIGPGVGQGFQLRWAQRPSVSGGRTALGAKGHRDSPEVAKRLGAQSPRPPRPGGPQLPVGRVPNTTLIFDNLPKGRNSLKADILTVTAGYREGYRLKSAEGRDVGGHGHM